jgi:hypothetical protein
MNMKQKLMAPSLPARKRGANRTVGVTLWVLVERDENGIEKPMTNIHGGIHRVRANNEWEARERFCSLDPEGGIPAGATVTKLLSIRAEADR